MPQLGETVAEGKITKWFKKAGDSVKPGDNLFEIETDKTSMEVPATTSGTLTEINFQVGEVAKVGAVVAVISGGSGETGRAATGAPPKAPIAPTSATPPDSAHPRESGSPGPRTGSPPSRGRTGASCVACLPAHGPVPRSPHARAQFRAGDGSAASPSRRWRGGSPASAASIWRRSKAPARMAASSRADVEGAPAARCARRQAAPVRPRSSRSTRRRLSRKCRSTAMRATIARAAGRGQVRPSRISI